MSTKGVSESATCVCFFSRPIVNSTGSDGNLCQRDHGVYVMHSEIRRHDSNTMSSSSFFWRCSTRCHFWGAWDVKYWGAKFGRTLRRTSVRRQTSTERERAERILTHFPHGTWCPACADVPSRAPRHQKSPRLRLSARRLLMTIASSEMVPPTLCTHFGCKSPQDEVGDEPRGPRTSRRSRTLESQGPGVGGFGDGEVAKGRGNRRTDSEPSPTAQPPSRYLTVFPS